jgi:hypothetical protein
MTFRMWTALLAAALLFGTPDAGMARSGSDSFRIGLRIKKAHVKPRAHERAIFTPGAAAISLVRANYGGIRYMGEAQGLYRFSARRSGQRALVWVARQGGRIVKTNALSKLTLR